MNSKRSILLTAGAVLAASLLANATTPAKPAISDTTTSTDSNETTRAKPAVCDEATPAKPNETARAKPAICNESKAAESTSSNEAIPAEPTVSNDAASGASAISSEASAGAVGSSAPQSTSGNAAASHTAISGSAEAAAPRSAAASQLKVSPKIFSPKTPVANSSSPEPHPIDSPNTVLTSEGLATSDTILLYCSQINPNGAQTAQQVMLMITQGHSSGEISAVRMSPDYAKTQVILNSQLAQVPYGLGVSGCRTMGTDGHGLPGVSTPIHRGLTASE
jgi:hypothetical protein